MPVRIADSMKQMNDLNSFPVAYGEDIWLDKNKGSGTPNYDSIQNMLNNDELGVGGSSIQVDTLPVANQSEVGNIYQYVGNNGTYKKGHFYECVLMHNYNGTSTSIYVWIDVGHLRFNHVVYNCTVPPVNTDYTPSDIIYYGGKTMGNFKSGHYYRAIPNATPQNHYGVALWVTPSSGYQYFCYTPFEFRIGFIVYPTGTGGESTPYQITDFDDEGITISPYGWSGTTKHFVGASYATTVEGWEELESGNPVIEDVNALPTSSDIENRIYRTKSVSPQTTEVLLVIPADVTQNERLMACTNTLSTWTVSGATLYAPKDEYWKWNDKEMYSITCDSTRTVFTTKTQSGGTRDDTYSIDVAWSSNFYVSPYEKAVYAGDKDTETNDRLALYSDVGGNIFYGTMDEWNALSADAKKQYEYMADEQASSEDNGEWKTAWTGSVSLPSTDGQENTIISGLSIANAKRIAIKLGSSQGNRIPDIAIVEHLIGVTNIGSASVCYLGDAEYYCCASFKVDFSNGTIRGNFISYKWAFTNTVVGVYWQ